MRNVEVANPMRIEITGNLITLSAYRVAIKDVLKAIADETQLPIILHGTLTEPVTIEFQRLPLPKAIGRVLRHYNFALHYAPHPDSFRGKMASSKLWVFAPGPDYFSNYKLSDKPTFSVDQLEPPNQHTALESAGGLIGPEEPDVITHLNYALADADPQVRLKAVSTLAEMGNEEAVVVLLSALGDSNPLIREEGVLAMGEIGGSTATQALPQLLLDQDPNVRVATINALVEISGEKSVPLLKVSLQDKNPSVREQAVNALGEIGGPAAIRLLQQALEDDEIKVRAAAIEAMAYIGGDDAARGLATALKDKDPSLRSEAADALESIGSDVAAQLLEQAPKEL